MINYQEFLDYLDDIHERVANGTLIIYDTINHIKKELIRNHDAYMKSLTDKCIKENKKALQKLGEK